MKKASKVISVILAFVMVLSMVPMAFAGTLKTDTYNTVEKLIQNDSIANILESLVTDINNSKTNVTGTVLRFVFMLLKDDQLTALIGDKDVAALDDAALAKILLDWVDIQLPVWTKDITNMDWYGPVSNLVKFIGITLDLKSVDGIIKTVYSLCDKADDRLPIINTPVLQLGIANNLKGAALKNLSRSSGDLNVIYGLIQWLTDNLPVLKQVVNGNLDLGIVSNFVDLSDVSALIRNIPLFIKSALYKLIDPNAEIGKLDKDAGASMGSWGLSLYVGYSADELLASALIKAIKGTDEIIPQAEAQQALTLSFYGILAQYADVLFNNFAVGWINENLPNFIHAISVTPEIAAKFKETIPAVDGATIADIVAGAKDTGFLGQLNNLVVKVAELVLVPDEFAKLGLTKTNGNNTDLNENLEKIFRYILPLMANEKVTESLGFSFEAFTQDAVKDMSIEQMGVAVLKLFFDTWFSSNPGYSRAAVASADTLEQLGVLAIYYTATNTNWLAVDYDFTPFAARIFDGDKVKAISTDEAEDLIISIAVGLGAGALLANTEYTKYSANFETAVIKMGDVNGDNELTAADARLALRAAVGFTDAEAVNLNAADVDGEGIGASDARLILRAAVGLQPIDETITVGAGWKDYVDDISDWALTLIKGLPAVIGEKKVSLQRGTYDPYNDNAFGKLNLVLNQLIDFHFLSGADNEEFVLDFDTLINKVLLGNIMDFNVEGLLATFEVNHDANNVLDHQFIPAVLGAVDRLVTALFKTV